MHPSNFFRKLINTVKKGKHSTIIALILILLCGIAIRLLSFGGQPFWWGDIARDYMVGFHIAKYHEIPVVGPTATGLSGAGGFFYYPPVYYYFVGLLIFLFKTPPTVTLFYIILNAFSVVAIYFIGKLLFSKGTGLWAAVFYVVSGNMISESYGMVSASTTVPIFLWVVLYLIWSCKKQSFPHMVIGLYLLSIVGVLYYSALVALMFFLCICLYILRKNIKQIICILLFVAAFNISLYYPLFQYFGFQTTVAAFLPQHGITSMGIGKIVQIGQMFLESEIDKNQIYINVMLVSSLVLFVVAVIQRRTVSLLAYPLTLLFLMLALSVVKGGVILDHAFRLYGPSLFLILGFLIDTVWRAHGRSIKLLVLVIALINLYIFAQGFYYFHFDTTEYMDDKNITDIIVKTINQYHLAGEYKLTVATEYDYSWESPTIWYLLETTTGQKLVKVINQGESLEEINTGKYYFLICKSTDKKWRGICYSEFPQHHIGYDLYEEIPLRLSLENYYSVYLFKRAY